MGHIYATSSGRVFPIHGAKKQRVKNTGAASRKKAQAVVQEQQCVNWYVSSSDEKYARPFDCGYIAVDYDEDFY